MFQPKELFEFTVFGLIRSALSLEWTRGAAGLGVVIDGKLSHFAIHCIILKISLSFHFKYIKTECGNGDC